MLCSVFGFASGIWQQPLLLCILGGTTSSCVDVTKDGHISCSRARKVEQEPTCSGAWNGFGWAASDAAVLFRDGLIVCAPGCVLDAMREASLKFAEGRIYLDCEVQFLGGRDAYCLHSPGKAWAPHDHQAPGLHDA